MSAFDPKRTLKVKALKTYIVRCIKERLMHTQSIGDFRHSHVFLGEAHERNERKTWAVIAVCTLLRKIAARLEQGSDRISDLHLWRLGPGHLAAVISLVTHNPHSPDIYKRRLLGISGLSHVTIEVLTCPGEHH